MTTQLTKEQLRDARLRAFENYVNSNCTPTLSSLDMDLQLLSKLHDVIGFNGGGASTDDMQRWYDQGFSFSVDPNFGLKQGMNDY